MTKEEIGAIIKKNRVSAGLTQAFIADQLNRPQQTIANWEVGRSQPDANTLFLLFQILGVSLDEAFGIHKKSTVLSEAEQSHLKKYRSLDDYGREAVDGVLDIEVKRYQEFLEEKARWKSRHTIQKSNATGHYPIKSFDIPMSAGTGAMAIEENPETVYLVKEPPHGADFIAPVKGDSMEPDFHDGDMVFVQSTPTIEIGQVGVFLLNGEQYIKELGEGVLISHNPKYEDIPFTEDIRCWGLVLDICNESYFE